MHRLSVRPTETELKLRLPPGARAALEGAASLAVVPFQQRRELTRYFDTDDMAVAAHGFSLRVRRSEDRKVQTLKGLATDGAAASERDEWEWPVAGEEPDLARLAETPLAELAPALVGRLRVAFTTDIERRTHRLTRPGSTEIEVSLDHGTIEAGQAREGVDELELELKRGDVGALYALATELHRSVPMWVAPDSKAARGYRLRTGAAPAASHAPKPRLDGGIRADEAFGRVLAAGLAHLLGNVAAASAADPEGVHQFRVALRRLRSALVLFRPLLEPHAVALFETELKRLGRLFGERRDLDVFCLQTLPTAADPLDGAWIATLRELAEARRQAVGGALREALHGAGLTGLVLGLATWAEDGAAHPEALGSKRLARKLEAVAPRLLDKLARKVAARSAQAGEPEALHDLRKSLKKLRYATEFVAGLYPPKAVKRYRAHCETLQELLGTINDAQVTPLLAESLASGRGAELAPAVARLSAWSVRRKQEAQRGLGDALREFGKAEPFWRDG